MFIAVIRRDLEKAIFIADVEPKSIANASTESPKGQDRYLSPPNSAAIQAYITAQGLSGTAAALIAATVPVYTGGVITLSNYNISSTQIKTVTGGGTSAAQVTALQALLAYHFVETDVVKKSFLNGNIKGYLSPYTATNPVNGGFNPDSRRFPAINGGQAIVCLADDGSTQYSVKTPIVTGAATNTPGAGALRISGASGGLAGYGLYETSVILIGKGAKRITQEQILAGGGTITDTQIDIPAPVVLGPTASNTYGAIAATLTQVRVQVNDMLSPAFTCT
jgi:hypothetical protein